MKNKNKPWNQNEFEFLKKEYPTYGAEYCALNLERNIKAIIAQANKLKIKSNRIKIKYLKENLEPIIKSSKTISEVIQKLKLTAIGGNHKTIVKYIKKYNIDISHFEQRSDRMRLINPAIALEKVLVENCNYNRVHLKNRLYKEGLKERKCEECGQGEIWMNKKISLIIDHVNGINNDNRLENLRIVCPNCAATLPTHAGKNNKKAIENREKEKIIKVDGRKKTRIERRVINRPSLELLQKEIDELGYSATGRKYGVSDNAIRKWIKSYEKYGV